MKLNKKMRKKENNNKINERTSTNNTYSIKTGIKKIKTNLT